MFVDGRHTGYYLFDGSSDFGHRDRLQASPRVLEVSVECGCDGAAGQPDSEPEYDCVGC